MIRRELEAGGSHGLPAPERTDPGAGVERLGRDLYAYHDLDVLQGLAAMQSSASASIRSIDELLERDRQREQDGFPRKIRVGRLIKPGRGGKDKVVVVPTTVEEKFIHDTSFQQRGGASPHGGSGEGEEGEVIGEQPVAARSSSRAAPGRARAKAGPTKWSPAPTTWAGS